MKRILISFLICLVGITASWIYLRPKEWSSEKSGKLPVIARALVTQGDVVRQEEGRLLWTPMRAGDSVYLGDKIKTANRSGLSLEFLAARSKLEIEENSVVVMSQVDKKFTLNMLEGRVFLKQENVAEDQKLGLMRGGKVLEVSDAAAVSVAKDGTSEVENFKVSAQELTFEELKPFYGEEVFLTGDQLVIRMKQIPGLSGLNFEHGETTSALTVVPVPVKEGMESFQIPLPPGNRYWKLTAKVGERDIRSPLMKMNILKPLPPVPISPANGEVVVLQNRNLDLKWSLGTGSDSVTLELAKDLTFQQLVEQKEITKQSFHTVEQILPEGAYHWRILTQLPGSEKKLVSKTNTFTVRHAETLMSPAPVSPAANMIYYLGKNSSDTLKFEWKPQDKVRGYRLLIEGPELKKEAEVSEPSAAVKLNKVGVFEWSVISLTLDGKESAFPVKRKIEIRTLKTIAWRMPKKSFLYLESIPVADLRWDPAGEAQFSLQVSATADFATPETFKVRGSVFPYRAQADGFFYAKVSSLDEAGEVSGESEVMEFKITKAPLPPAPVLTQTGTLTATSGGDFTVSVENMPPELDVVAQLTDKSGATIDERRFGTKDVSFSGLLPGTYFLKTKFQDEYKRQGEAGQRIEIVVPQKSLISAPKIKAIKVR